MSTKEHAMTSSHLPPIPSVARYKDALRIVREQLNDGQIAMLRAQYLAPDRTMTATELAVAAGYRSYRGTNLQYGKMGQLVRDVLGYDAEGAASYVLSLFCPPHSVGNPEWLFVMHEKVAQALHELGWFRHWKSSGGADE
jgi:hypothetical protein